MQYLVSALPPIHMDLEGLTEHGRPASPNAETVAAPVATVALQPIHAEAIASSENVGMPEPESLLHAVHAEDVHQAEHAPLGGPSLLSSAAMAAAVDEIGSVAEQVPVAAAAVSPAASPAAPPGSTSAIVAATSEFQPVHMEGRSESLIHDAALAVGKVSLSFVSRNAQSNPGHVVHDQALQEDPLADLLNYEHTMQEDTTVASAERYSQAAGPAAANQTALTAAGVHLETSSAAGMQPIAPPTLIAAAETVAMPDVVHNLGVIKEQMPALQVQNGSHADEDIGAVASLEQMPLASSFHSEDASSQIAHNLLTAALALEKQSSEQLAAAKIQTEKLTLEKQAAENLAEKLEERLAAPNTGNAPLAQQADESAPRSVTLAAPDASVAVAPRPESQFAAPEKADDDLKKAPSQSMTSFTRSGRRHLPIAGPGVSVVGPFNEELSLKDPNAHLDSEDGGIMSLFGSSHGALMWITLVLTAATVSGSICLVCGFCASTVLWRRASSGATRMYIEKLPVCKSDEIEKRLPMRGGYDCTFSKPLSSQLLLRIEAYVQDPLVGSLLTAPLTQQTCVFYSSVVSQKLHDGVHPVPVAFASASVNFSVALADAPHMRIDIQGKDMAFFDMKDGKSVQRRSRRIPEHWEDFISTHRTAPRATSPVNDGSLEFQECTLLVGTLVTLIGELHRGSNGTLSLRPFPEDTACMSSAPRERWRTSWEGGQSSSYSAKDFGDVVADQHEKSLPSWSDPAAEARIEKVLVSDDPGLLDKGLSSWAALLERHTRTFGPWADYLVFKKK